MLTKLWKELGDPKHLIPNHGTPSPMVILGHEWDGAEHKYLDYVFR